MTSYKSFRVIIMQCFDDFFLTFKLVIVFYDVIVIITVPDRNPEEISWKIVDAYTPGRTIKQKNRYKEPFTKHMKNVCLKEDRDGTDCYRFIISDRGGDGLTDFRRPTRPTRPYYKALIREGGKSLDYSIIKENMNGRKYSVEKSQAFGACKNWEPSPPRCDSNEVEMKMTVKTDNKPRQISWKFKNKNGKIIPDAKGPFYTKSYHKYVHKFCVRKLSCPTFIIKDQGNDGIVDGGGFNIKYYSKRTGKWRSLYKYGGGRYSKIEEKLCVGRRRVLD